jgi:hypothetical protein
LHSGGGGGRGSEAKEGLAEKLAASDPTGACGRGCGAACWRERLVSFLGGARGRHLAAKLAARHAARHGCAYEALLLAEAAASYGEPVPWQAPALELDAAKDEADEVRERRRERWLVAGGGGWWRSSVVCFG